MNIITKNTSGKLLIKRIRLYEKKLKNSHKSGESDKKNARFPVFGNLEILDIL